MDDRQHYDRLVKRYLENSATQEEVDLFFHLLEQGKLEASLQKLAPAADDSLAPGELSAGKKQLAHSYQLLRYAVAASVLLAILTAVFLSSSKKVPVTTSLAQKNTMPQAAPGTKKAILTLSNGQQVTLGGVTQNLTDGNASMVAKSNRIEYQRSNVAAEPEYHSISTPKGGEYQLTLPDGTQVWLNAGTSLRYPTAFSGSQRRVELTGEAYFEVVKNPAKPFVVHTNGADIKVLGTAFNVMAYADESFLKTTLAEGSVAMTANGDEVVLKPGEGATVVATGNRIEVAAADLDQDLAWKNGNFYFRKTELAAIMKQIARWYDLEIRYAGAVPKKHFAGRIPRQNNLSDVLDVFRLSGIQFSMTGRTLVVEE